jgi:hypothetical protein
MTASTMKNHSWFQSPVVFYILTVIISSFFSWLLAANVTTFVFNHFKVNGLFQYTILALYEISPYAVFFAGIAGCLWFNIRYSTIRKFKDYCLSILSSVGGSTAIGSAFFILTFVIQFIFFVILIVIMGLIMDLIKRK